MAKRRTPTPEDRVAEYVDSPVVTQRLKSKRQLSARIQGNYGVYRTHVSTTGRVSGDCTCPSEWSPCKHIVALRKTWDVNPNSFFDLDEFIAELSQQSQASLIRAIGQIVLERPECLSVFGVPGFEEPEDGDWLDQ